MWNKTLIFSFVSAATIILSFYQDVQYREVAFISHNTSSILSGLENMLVSKGDGGHILAAYTEVIGDIPPGFYLDTLTNKIFINDCEVEKAGIKISEEKDIDRLIRVGEIEIGGQYISDKTVKVANLRSFFKHKVDINLMVKNMVFNIQNSEMLTSGKPIDTFIDLDGDHIKERIIFKFNYIDEKHFDELEIYFAHKIKKGWSVYDHIGFRAYQFKNEEPKLAGSLERVALIKTRNNFPPVLLINTSSRDDRGGESQSQILLMARSILK